MTKVFITGGTGFIGSHLADALLKKGYSVKCLVRKTSNIRWLENKNIEFVHGDLFSNDALAGAVKDVDYVYHLGGVTFAKKKEEYYRGNSEATKNFTGVVYRSNPGLKRFVFVSSQTVVGPSLDGIPVDEETECHPITTYGRSKLEAENYVKEYFDKMKCTIVRAPAVLGPRDVAIYEYFKSMSRGLQPLIGLGEQRVSLINSSDLVDGIILAGESEKAVSQLYFITPEKDTSWREVGKITSRLMNRRTIPIKIPHFVVFTVGAIAQFFSMFSSKPAILNLEKCKDLTRKYWICSAKKAMTELGYRENLGLEKGLKMTIDWYKENGWIK